MKMKELQATLFELINDYEDERSEEIRKTARELVKALGWVVIDYDYQRPSDVAIPKKCIDKMIENGVDIDDLEQRG